jgi:Protein of unknown function (DUF2934)
VKFLSFIPASSPFLRQGKCGGFYSAASTALRHHRAYERKGGTMKQRVVKPQNATAPTSEQIQAWIAEAAYYRAERRGFEPGRETEDWLAAEAEVLARMRAGERTPTPA